jgi:hypothetical protein
MVRPSGVTDERTGDYDRVTNHRGGINRVSVLRITGKNLSTDGATVGGGCTDKPRTFQLPVNATKDAFVQHAAFVIAAINICDPVSFRSEVIEPMRTVVIAD